MNLISLLLGFLIMGFVFVGGGIVLVLGVMGKGRSALRVLGATFGGLALVVGGLFILRWLTDNAVRSPVASERIAGTYRLSPLEVDSLRHMGYEKFEGEITLKRDGSFTALQIPACCIHGWDESSNTFTGGYYRLSGTWNTESSHSSDAQIVRLVLVTTELTGQVKTGSPELEKERRALSECSVNLLKGSPFDLGFPIFNGDFRDVVFSREK